ncbi:quinone oxidoreductase, putative [Bodo saltans]|uniref:Quinone oxidoreductase, putative n=1 Tax=Bodo saltans TaxID=75058 RepID=A0A0S4JMB1_BODSA|nr:quinone oxidoreductase, putative [Bodo saltans]|eukprot:CUG90525.1 quinone oxidoreductase, putative [Bodo saltans]
MANTSLPPQFKKLVVQKLSTKFRQSTAIETTPFPTSIKPTEVIVKNIFAGINASDINFTAGTYKKGVHPPFDCGFESIGRVVQCGEVAAGKHGFAVGDAVIAQAFGGFSEYQVVPSRSLKKAPSVDAHWLPLDLSRTTASIALAEVVQPKKGEVALVTAAAGGTGQFAVQLLKKHYGCTVVGTCSSEAKRDLLKRLGCDVVINYKTEDASEVLTKTFPTGVNCVYESVGGAMMELALKHLALRGRICTIGSISGYQDLSSWKEESKCTRVPIPSQLLMKSASLRGFFLPHFQKYADAHFAQLVALHNQGVISSNIDPKAFVGLESVSDAVDYLHSGQNVGKVVVKLADE